MDPKGPEEEELNNRCLGSFINVKSKLSDIVHVGQNFLNSLGDCRMYSLGKHPGGDLTVLKPEIAPHSESKLSNLKENTNRSQSCKTPGTKDAHLGNLKRTHRSEPGVGGQNSLVPECRLPATIRIRHTLETA
jgi:hypothetical protein